MRNRKNRVDLHLSDEEAARLKALTTATGYSASALLRAMLMGYQLKECPTEDILEFNRQMLRIGTNLNQIAVKANARGLLDAPYYRQQAEQWQALRSEMLERLTAPEKMPEDVVGNWLEKGAEWR